MLYGHTVWPPVPLLAPKAEHHVRCAWLLRKAGSVLGASPITMRGLVALNTSQTTVDMPLSGTGPLPVWPSLPCATRAPQSRENLPGIGEE